MLRRLWRKVWHEASPRLLIRQLESRNRQPVCNWPITVLVHREARPDLNAVFVEWIGRNFPAEAAQIVYKSLPLKPEDLRSGGAVVFWLQDPVAERSPRAYEQALAAEALCAAAGVPTVNPPSLYDRTDRIDVVAALDEAGLATPRAAPIDSLDDLLANADSLSFPFVIRERRGHQRDLFRIDGKTDLSNPRLRDMDDPVRVEWINVSTADNDLYRKYRCLVIGDRVVPHHLQISPSWITRGEDRVTEPWAKDEELAFLNAPVPEAASFLAASKRIGLDVLAYDFGRTRDGKIVVWEANPYPFIWFSGADRWGLYRADAIHKTYAALLELYLKKAGHPVPEALEAILSDNPQTAAAALRGLAPIVASGRMSVPDRLAVKGLLPFGGT